MITPIFRKAGFPLSWQAPGPLCLEIFPTTKTSAWALFRLLLDPMPAMPALLFLSRTAWSLRTSSSRIRHGWTMHSSGNAQTQQSPRNYIPITMQLPGLSTLRAWSPHWKATRSRETLSSCRLVLTIQRASTRTGSNGSPLQKFVKGRGFSLSSTLLSGPSSPPCSPWSVLANLFAHSQGFASGNFDDDAWAIRYFASRPSMEMAVAQSFSKNFGLYGERVGALHILASEPGVKPAVQSQLVRVLRSEISSGTAFGSRVAAAVLDDSELKNRFFEENKKMSSRIKTMRAALVAELERLGTPGNWSHITNQVRSCHCL